MKHLFIISLLFISMSGAVFSQSYSKYMQQGKDFFKNNEYFTALERFDLAYDLATAETEKSEAKTWKNKSRDKIRDQQAELKKALASLKEEKNKSDSMMRIALTQKLIADKEREIAEIQKQKAELALKMAEEMQNKMESAVFDRAAKDEIPIWTNSSLEMFNDNYSKIVNLNLANSGLSRIPWEVYQCKNLESINLIGNEMKDWNKVFTGLSNLEKLKDIQISINSVDSIPLKYRNKITGASYYTELLMDIPPALFSFQSLKYLFLRGFWREPKMYEARDITMSDYERKKRYLSPLIGQLTMLETLDLSGCGLNKLPNEISKLKNLKSLILYDNTFPDSEKQKIKNLLPNCDIKF